MFLVLNVNCIHLILTVNSQIHPGSCHKTAVPPASCSLASCLKHPIETKGEPKQTYLKLTGCELMQV